MNSEYKMKHVYKGEEDYTNISALVQCDCGCFMQRKTKESMKHLKSQRHQKGLKAVGMPSKKSQKQWLETLAQE